MCSTTSRGKPVVVTADPTCCSGSRATVGNGTCGRRLLPTDCQVLAPSHKRRNCLMPESFDAIRNAQVAQRRNAQSARSQLTADDRMNAAEKIASTVAHSSWFARADFIGCYLAANSETNTWPIISRAWRRKKRIFAPVAGKKGSMQFCEVTAESMLLPNRFGLLEPVDACLLCLAFYVPYRTLYGTSTYYALFWQAL